MERTARLALYAAAGAVLAALYARRAATPVVADGGGDLLEEITVTARRVAQPLLPRGIRLNNPGNIRRGSSAWQGMAPVQTDEYVKFTEAKWGLRALAKLLTNYHRAGFTTVRRILNRYAPPVENETTAYVRHVCQLMLVQPDQPLAFPAQLPNLMAAIIRHENGMQPYSTAEIAEGIRLAA